MSNIRANCVDEQIKIEISDIINNKIKDISIVLLNIIYVEVIVYLHQSKVFFSVLGDEEEREETLHGLSKANGFIRSEIGQRIRLRKVPEIIFEYDVAHEYGNHIDALLRDLEE